MRVLAALECSPNTCWASPSQGQKALLCIWGRLNKRSVSVGWTQVSKHLKANKHCQDQSVSSVLPRFYSCRLHLLFYFELWCHPLIPVNFPSLCDRIGHPNVVHLSCCLPPPPVYKLHFPLLPFSGEVQCFSECVWPKFPFWPLCLLVIWYLCLIICLLELDWINRLWIYLNSDSEPKTSKSLLTSP